MKISAGPGRVFFRQAASVRGSVSLTCTPVQLCLALVHHWLSAFSDRNWCPFSRLALPGTSLCCEVSSFRNCGSALISRPTARFVGCWKFSALQSCPPLCASGGLPHPALHLSAMMAGGERWRWGQRLSVAGAPWAAHLPRQPTPSMNFPLASPPSLSLGGSYPSTTLPRWPGRKQPLPPGKGLLLATVGLV